MEYTAWSKQTDKKPDTELIHSHKSQKRKAGSEVGLRSEFQVTLWLREEVTCEMRHQSTILLFLELLRNTNFFIQIISSSHNALSPNNRYHWLSTYLHYFIYYYQYYTTTIWGPYLQQSSTERICENLESQEGEREPQESSWLQARYWSDPPLGESPLFSPLPKNSATSSAYQPEWLRLT